MWIGVFVIKWMKVKIYWRMQKEEEREIEDEEIEEFCPCV